jgi:hypothetical protein
MLLLTIYRHLVLTRTSSLSSSLALYNDLLPTAVSYTIPKHCSAGTPNMALISKRRRTISTINKLTWDERQTVERVDTDTVEIRAEISSAWNNCVYFSMNVENSSHYSTFGVLLFKRSQQTLGLASDCSSRTDPIVDPELKITM